MNCDIQAMIYKIVKRCRLLLSEEVNSAINLQR